MHALLPLFIGLLACTTTETPSPEAAGDQVAVEDTGAVSAKAPGQLAATIKQELADDPDAPAAAEPAEGEAAPAEDAAPEGEPTAASTAPTEADLPTRGKKAPPPCDGIDGALAKAVAGDTAGLEVDAQGRVRVTYEFSSEPAQLPDGFEKETSAMGHGQGWCPPAQLCALAVTDGIDRVRPVRRASPKPD